MKDKHIVYDTKEKISEYSFVKNFGKKLSPAGTLLMSFKLTVGRVSILGVDAIHNEAIISIFPYYNEENKIRNWLLYTLGLLVEYVDKTDAIKGSTLNRDKMNKMLIPLPPQNEQTKILEKINSFEPLIKKYENFESKLTDLEQAFPEKLKKSILQYAIEGKLVKQDPDDEPASVLLERIKTEKEKLIKEGKIKRDKNEYYIYQGDDKNYYENKEGKDIICDELVGFSIPSSWAFSNIGNITSYGFTILKRKININDWLLELEDIESSTSKLLRLKKVTTKTNLNSKVSFQKGMVLYSKLRPYLDKVLIAHEDGIATSEIVPFLSFIDSNYLLLYLKSPLFLNRVTNLMYGVKMPRLGTIDMNSSIIPIPPINEQKRILNKVMHIIQLI